MKNLDSCPALDQLARAENEGQCMYEGNEFPHYMVAFP
jgi:hypothetical protein